MYSSIFSEKKSLLKDNVQIYGRAVQATENNTVHAHFILDNPLATEFSFKF